MVTEEGKTSVEGTMREIGQIICGPQQIEVLRLFALIGKWQTLIRLLGNIQQLLIQVSSIGAVLGFLKLYLPPDV